ncbi:excalibur calcium-binding domain-containing protein [Salinarimonas rosea]|uniref:excalibur calcium-binding domain-containing protein n=1 Tax=Salinarimonas rosea TaxID=552063 RepID=UPI00040DD5CB|nr:excalibur calcium-binding domain-containing protein [Salinarimonas rosea]
MPARIARQIALAGLLAGAALAGAAAAESPGFRALSTPIPSLEGRSVPTQGAPIVLAQRRTCRSARSCREAVEMWCGGYRRADGDGDGIPCESVCRSRAQVEEIRSAIGC